MFTLLEIKADRTDTRIDENNYHRKVYHLYHGTFHMFFKFQASFPSAASSGARRLSVHNLTMYKYKVHKLVSSLPIFFQQLIQLILKRDLEARTTEHSMYHTRALKLEQASE